MKTVKETTEPIDGSVNSGIINIPFTKYKTTKKQLIICGVGIVLLILAVIVF